MWQTPGLHRENRVMTRAFSACRASCLSCCASSWPRRTSASASSSSASGRTATAAGSLPAPWCRIPWRRNLRFGSGLKGGRRILLGRRYFLGEERRGGREVMFELSCGCFLHLCFFFFWTWKRIPLFVYCFVHVWLGSQSLMEMEIGDGRLFLGHEKSCGQTNRCR